MNQPWYPQQPGYPPQGPPPPSVTSYALACITSGFVVVSLVWQLISALLVIDIMPAGTVVLVLLQGVCMLGIGVGAGLLISKQVSGGMIVAGFVALLLAVLFIDVLRSPVPGMYVKLIFDGDNPLLGVVLFSVPAAVLGVVPPTLRYIRYAKATTPQPGYPQPGYPQPGYPPQQPQPGYPPQPPPPGYPPQQGHPYQGPQPPRW